MVPLYAPAVVEGLRKEVHGAPQATDSAVCVWGGMTK